MRLLGLLLIAAALTLPFLFLRRPWAIGLWRKIRIIVVVYVIVIVVAAIVRLVFNWDEIY